jgi:hypothetical protein
MLSLALVWISEQDFKAAEKELELYCEMIKMHEDTGGQVGWPDFENKKEECEEKTK